MRDASPKPTPTARALTAGPATRLLGPDLARGLAYVFMILAHTAPSDGPMRVFMMTEFLTAPLYATLLGVGVALSWAHAQAGGVGSARRGRFLPRHLVRAGILIVLGAVVGTVYHSIIPVLAQLGAAEIVLALLIRLPVLARLACIPAFVALSVVIASTRSSWGLSGWLHDVASVVDNGSYHLGAFIAFALAGTLLVDARRAVAEHRSAWDTAWLWLGLAAACEVLFLAGAVAPNFVGIGVHAYDGSLPTTVATLFGAAGIVLAAHGVSPAVAALPAVVQRFLLAPGWAALTLYVLQFVLLRLWVEATGRADDAWIVVIAMITVPWVAAFAWQETVRAVRIRQGERSRLSAWVRGPLEGLSATLADATAATIVPESRPESQAPSAAS